LKGRRNSKHLKGKSRKNEDDGQSTFTSNIKNSEKKKGRGKLTRVPTLKTGEKKNSEKTEKVLTKIKKSRKYIGRRKTQTKKLSRKEVVREGNKRVQREPAIHQKGTYLTAKEMD